MGVIKKEEIHNHMNGVDHSLMYHLMQSHDRTNDLLAQLLEHLTSGSKQETAEIEKPRRGRKPKEEN